MEMLDCMEHEPTVVRFIPTGKRKIKCFITDQNIQSFFTKNKNNLGAVDDFKYLAFWIGSPEYDTKSRSALTWFVVK